MPDISARGWAVSAHWLVAGKRKRGIVQPQSGFPSSIGALVLSVRYEGLSFDDSGPDTSGSSPSLRAADVRSADASALTAGLSWWPIKWIRLVGDASWEWFRPSEIAPETEREGSYCTIAARLQLRLP
jgi:hypothetical protein